MTTLHSNANIITAANNSMPTPYFASAKQAWQSVNKLAQALRPDFITLFERLPHIGETETLVTNCAVCYQQTGLYSPARWQKTTGLVLNPRAIDQRLFSAEWQSLFAIHNGSEVALQIFDNQGLPVMTIRPTSNANLAEWQKIITDFHWTNPQAPEIHAKKIAALTEHSQPLANEVEKQWRAMTDVHQFFGLLRQNKLSRQQAFRLVPEDLAYQVGSLAVVALLENVRNDKNEIMIFITNTGCIQIFTGAVQQTTLRDGNLSITAEKAVLNLNTAKINESWVTRKPSGDGYVTSLELFNANGQQIAQLYGQRTEGNAEQTTWRQQLGSLAPLKGVA